MFADTCHGCESFPMPEPALPDFVTRFSNGVTALSIDWAWRWELVATRNLLDNAYQMQVASVEVASNIDSMLTLLTLGVEKALKLGLGCCHSRDTGGEWPRHLSKPGHHSKQLQADLLRKAVRAAAGQPYEAEVAELVERIKNDIVWQYMILVLDMYGSGGRFHYLDVLAQNPKRVILGGPRESWLAILMIAMEQAGNEFGEHTTAEEMDELINQAICASMLMWRECISRLGLLGAFGELGVELGRSLAN